MISELELRHYFFGMMKCKSAQSSLSEFWSGVPVIRIRWLASKPMSVLYSRESSFFSLWASSTPSTAQLMLCRKDYKSNNHQLVIITFSYVHRDIRKNAYDSPIHRKTTASSTIPQPSMHHLITYAKCTSLLTYIWISTLQLEMHITYSTACC